MPEEALFCSNCRMRLSILAFAAGIFWLQQQSRLPESGTLFLCLLLALVLTGALLRWWRRGWWLGALPTALLAGVLWASSLASARLDDALAPEWEGREVTVVGVIADLPQQLPHGQRFLFQRESCETPDARVPEKLWLGWYGGGRVGAADLRPGQRWRLTLRLKRPHGHANPHGFDYEAWLFERGIRATGYVRAKPAPVLLNAMVWSPELAIERWRWYWRQGLQAALPAADYPYAGVIVALALGDQRAIAPELWSVFSRTGVVHLFSVSGLHVTMLAALAAGLFAAFWRRWPALCLRLPARRAGVLAGVLTAAIYSLIAGFGIPAQRTLYMLGVAALALYCGRPLAASRVLALALLLVLLFDPLAVQSAGFWLSFAAVAALLFIAGGRREHERSWRALLLEWARTQWAATLVTLPLLLWLFQQFSLVSPLSNAFAIPAVSLLLTPLALLATVLPVWPLPEVAHALLSVLMAALRWCAAWPVWQAPAPDWSGVVLALAGVAWLLLPRGFPGRWLGAILILPLLLTPAPRPEHGEAWVEVLDVGQGQAVLIRTQQHALLYDVGPGYAPSADAGQRVLLPYLRSQGVTHLDRVVLSHRDRDHVGGFFSLAAALPIGEIFSSFPVEAGGEACVRGMRWQWESVDFAFLHPRREDIGRVRDGNRISCVLRVTAAGKSLLLPGDVDVRTEAELLADDPAALAADLVLLPHHGSRSSSSPAFVAAVAAREALVSAGYRNPFGHPRPEVVERYRNHGARLWRTDRDGALSLQLGASGVRISAWRQLRQRYWQTPWSGPDLPAICPQEDACGEEAGE